jgi:hypothetical protein
MLNALCARSSHFACIDAFAGSCPTGAICPGGSRAWPLPGYFSSDQASADVLRCSPPDATARCRGWSTALKASVCGAGYKQGSYLCSVCDTSYYRKGDGTCSACPVSPSLFDRFYGLFMLLIGISCFAVLTYVVLHIAVRANGGHLKLTGSWTVSG